MRRLIDSLLLVLVAYSVTWPLIRSLTATPDSMPSADLPAALRIHDGTTDTDGGLTIEATGLPPLDAVDVLLHSPDAADDLTGHSLTVHNLTVHPDASGEFLVAVDRHHDQHLEVEIRAADGTCLGTARIAPRDDHIHVDCAR